MGRGSVTWGEIPADAALQTLERVAWAQAFDRSYWP